jgi:hypothetical protein
MYRNTYGNFPKNNLLYDVGLIKEGGNSHRGVTGKGPKVISYNLIFRFKSIRLRSAVLNIIMPRDNFTYIQALLEKPPVLQLPKNFPKFCETRRFIKVFTTALHWFLSRAR